MSSAKRPRDDENTPISTPITSFEFRDGLKRWRKSRHVSEDEIRVLREQRAANDAQVAAEQKERLMMHAQAAKEAHCAEENARLQRVLDSVTDAGLTLYGFLDELMNTKDRATSSQVS
jgi:hypothetical protein